MTNDEWATIALLLHRGFKWSEPFGAAHDRAYRTLLDGYEADQISRTLSAFVARGQVFGPTPGEIVAEIRRDPDTPTFAEACTQIFGRGGVLKARTPIHKGSWEAGERDRLDEEAAWERAGQVHPLIGAFVRAQGLDRLRRLDLADPEYGAARRKQLGDEWETFVEVHETRDVAALVAERRPELRRFDPLRALPAARERFAS